MKQPKPLATDVALQDAAMHGPAIEWAVLSRVGGRQTNEDSCGHWRSEDRLACVVADGAGGHGGGDIASRLAVRHILDQVAATPINDAQELHELLLETNAAVRHHRDDGQSQRNMHTTVVALFIDLQRGEALWGHVGDSRLYLFRGGRMVQHTRDHSLVQTLADAGLIHPDQMRTHPQRSELQSALGIEPDLLQVSTADEAWLLHEGDTFLLCTDGLWEYVDDDEMCASLTSADDVQGWLQRLEQLVLSHAAEAHRPGHDNYSAIAVWVGNGR